MSRRRRVRDVSRRLKSTCSDRLVTQPCLQERLFGSPRMKRPECLGDSVPEYQAACRWVRSVARQNLPRLRRISVMNAEARRTATPAQTPLGSRSWTYSTKATLTMFAL